MTTVLLIFYLITTPYDHATCSLWTETAPTSTQVIEACGEIDLAAHRLQVVNLATRVPLCDLEAGQIYSITEACTLQGRLDGYRLDIYRPDYERLLCSVETPYASPTDAEIAEQCGDGALQRYLAGNARLQFVREKEIAPETPNLENCEPPMPTTGGGLLNQPKNAAELASKKNYYLLAGKLIWFGYATPECDGLSGVDVETGAATPCGMESARTEMESWQNQLDDAIYQAALAEHVPARLLKELIARESQFWGWTGANDEAGLVQITDAGADLVLRYTLEGYHQESNARRAELRAAWLDELRCHYCTPDETMQHAAAMMPRYAQALAAYYCQEGSWEAAASEWNEKHAQLFGG